VKQKTRKSYWFLPVFIILLFVLAACVRPAPQPEQPEGTATPLPQATIPEIPTQIPSSPTPPPEAGYPGIEVSPTPESGGATDPNAGGGEGGGEVVVVEPTAVSPALPTNHTVQAGDTLYSISNRYGVSQEEIAAANNITTSGLLTVGQVLIIPAPGTTLPGQPEQPIEPPTGERVHVVQPGENLFRISLRYGKSVDEVAAYNGIANPHYIYPGQVIRIP
jgi:LysM repeat protein